VIKLSAYKISNSKKLSFIFVCLLHSVLLVAFYSDFSIDHQSHLSRVVLFIRLEITEVATLKGGILTKAEVIILEEELSRQKSQL